MSVSIQEQITSIPDAAVYGKESSFRAALSAAMNEPEAPAAVIPQDVQDAQVEQHVDMSSDQKSPLQSDVSESDDEDHEKSASEVETSNHETPEVETKQHLIPKSRFNKEIEKRKDLETQLTAERESRIRYETQLQMMSQLQQATSPQQPVIHEPEIDPLDADTYNYAKREIDALKQQLANVSQETESRTREMMYYNTVQAQEAAFQRDHPDFNTAMKHVQDVELNIAKQMMAGDERAANDYVAAKLRDVLTRSLNGGKNAAETIYNMAKTYGYNSTPSATKATPTKDIGAIAKNMERTANTSNLGNSSSFGNIPTDIASAMDKSGRVDPEAFHKMLDKVRARI